jgi:energy-coupling factor transporter ATP-binding protein EcfA2
MESMATRNPPLIGVTLDGPPPLGVIDLRLDCGVFALYGLNGIGKTRVLEALGRALAGYHVSENTWVHVRFDAASLAGGADQVLDDALVFPLREAIGVTLQQNYPGEGPPVDLDSDSIRQMIEMFAKAKTEIGISTVSEMIDRGCFSLCPVGRSSPLWHVWLSADPMDDAPWTRWLIQQHRLMLTPSPETSPENQERPTAEEAAEALRTFLAENFQFTLAGTFVHFARRSQAEHEAWVPTPIAYLGDLELDTGVSISLTSEEESDLAERSIRLVQKCAPIIEVADEYEVEPSESARGMLQRMGDAADEELGKVLGHNAPVLACVLKPWGVAPPIEWVSVDLFSGDAFPIAELGSGRSRWAVMAAHLAVANLSNMSDPERAYSHRSDSVLIIDEPELGLHPAAVHEMFNGLTSWADGRTVIVATHSGAAMSDERITLIYVDRNELGQIVCKPMEPRMHNLLQGLRSKTTRDAVESLGLGPSDVLQTVRRFIIVEGEHDAALIEAILAGEELSRARVAVLPMRGSHNLMSVLGAQMIFDYTSADVLVVLDRTNGAHFEDVWGEAKRLHESGNDDASLRVLAELSDGTAEEQKLREFCERAIRTDRSRRIEVYGLSKADVILYLPVKGFIPHASSWDEVVQSWDRNACSFKEHVARGGRAVTVRRVRELAGKLDCLHDDLVELRKRCLGLS